MLNPSFMTAPLYERASAGGAPAPRRPAARTTIYRSFHQHATVDVEALAVDEAGSVGEQEQDGVRDLFRLAEAAHRHAARDQRPLLGSERRVHRGVAGSGVDAVDADPGAGDRAGEALRHRDDRALARRVGNVGDAAAAELVAVRADRDDPALAARQHALERSLHREEGALGVHREDAVPLLGGDL